MIEEKNHIIKNTNLFKNLVEEVEAEVEVEVEDINQVEEVDLNVVGNHQVIINLEEEEKVTKKGEEVKMELLFIKMHGQPVKEK